MGRSLQQQEGGAVVAESGSFLFTIIAAIILAPCILAGVAQTIYCYKKSRRDRVERKIDAVSNNPVSRLLVLNELFKNSSKLVTDKDASPKKKRVQVKKRRKKTPEERQASRDALDDQLQSEDVSTDSWWGEEEVKSTDGLDDQQPAFIIITHSRDDGNDLIDREETVSTPLEVVSVDELSEGNVGDGTVERKQNIESANDVDSPDVKVIENTDLAIESNIKCVESEAVDANAKVEEQKDIPLGSAHDSEEESHQSDRDGEEMGERQSVVEKCLESGNSSPESRSLEDPSDFVPRTPTRVDALSQDALFTNEASPIPTQAPNYVQLTPRISNTSDVLEPVLSGDELTAAQPNSDHDATGIPSPSRTRSSDDEDRDRVKERNQSIFWLGDGEASKEGRIENRPSNPESTDLARGVDSPGGVPVGDFDESSQTQESISSLYLPYSLKPTNTNGSIRSDSLDAVPLYHVDSGLASLRTDLSSHVSYFSYEDVSLASDELDTW